MANRFYRWQRKGLWQRLFATLLQQAYAQKLVDWSLHFVDGTVIRAHHHAAGARKSGENEALGRSRGGFSTKLYIRTDWRGKPLVLLVTAGQRHEQTMFVRLMEAGVVQSGRRGRPRRRPHRLSGDKGYRSRRTRQYLRQRGIGHSYPAQGQ